MTRGVSVNGSSSPDSATGNSSFIRVSCLARWLETKKKMISKNTTSIMGVMLKPSLRGRVIVGRLITMIPTSFQEAFFLRRNGPKTCCAV